MLDKSYEFDHERSAYFNAIAQFLRENPHLYDKTEIERAEDYNWNYLLHALQHFQVNLPIKQPKHVL